MLAGIADRSRVQAVVDRGEAIRTALEQACPGDVVVIAGKGHETTQEIDGRMESFDDRLVAASFLEAC